jgi:hypothetical protein
MPERVAVPFWCAERAFVWHEFGTKLDVKNPKRSATFRAIMARNWHANLARGLA